MFFVRFKQFQRKNLTNQRRFVGFVSLCLILLSWPAIHLIDNFQTKLFGVPLTYFFIVMIGPVLILLITSSAIKISDAIDRKNLETEND